MADATATLNEISGALNALANQVLGALSDDRSFMEVWVWTAPAINRHEFAEIIREPINYLEIIVKNGGEIKGSDFNLLTQYPARISYFQSQVYPQLAGGNAFHVYISARSLVNGLIDVLSKYSSPEMDWKEIEDRKLLPGAQLRRLKQVSSAIERLSGDSSELQQKIAEINGAHEAAEALPSTLQELADARKALTEAGKVIWSDKDKAADTRAKIEGVLETILQLEVQAKQKVENIEQAYSAATTLGLGKAFGDRAKSLSLSTWGLVVILAATLGVGGWISANRISFVQRLMERALTAGKDIPMDLLWANVTLTVVSVAAPVWFAWVLTKQIGQRFRLAEDYGFKASVAKAYEGYRREAINVDQEMVKRLLGLALDRIDEAPLRLVERETHGSPIQEMLGGIVGKRTSEDNSASNDRGEDKKD